MKLDNKWPYSKLTVFLALGVVGVLVVPLAWHFATAPVLFHSHILATKEDRRCAEYNGHGTGLPILNPFRSRCPERVADIFLRAWSSAHCLADWDEAMCKATRNRRYPGGTWRLVNRRDSDTAILLIYKIESAEQAKHGWCLIINLDLRRTGANWRVFGFGSGGHCQLCPG